MLERCLQSLGEQLPPSDVRLSIIIVDNDPAGGALNVVTDYVRAALFDVRYIHEPRRGIAIARNAALDASMGAGADWIAFIDDDEWAEPDWIAGLMAPEYRNTPLLLGAIIHESPDRAPFWLTGRRHAGGVKGIEGELRKTGTTGNVRLSAELIRAGFRFDEGLGFMGGEDNEMFTRARKAGFAIRRTLKAIVTEAAHPERATYMAQMYRAYWCAASDMRRTAIDKGWPGAILRKLHTVPLNIAFGVLEIAASPLYSIFGVDAFKRRALAGGKKIAKGFGRAIAILGLMPQPYRVIVGH